MKIHTKAILHLTPWCVAPDCFFQKFVPAFVAFDCVRMHTHCLCEKQEKRCFLVMTTLASEDQKPTLLHSAQPMLLGTGKTHRFSTKMDFPCSLLTFFCGPIHLSKDITSWPKDVCLGWVLAHCRKRRWTQFCGSRAFFSNNSVHHCPRTHIHP